MSTRKHTPTALFAALVLAAVVGRPALAQATATQTVTFEVQPINQIAVSGTPSALTVSGATAGSAPTSATSTGASWALTTNESAKKLTASINSDMPSGLTLAVAVTAPSTGTTAGTRTLASTPVDVVTGIGPVNASGLAITYHLTATAAAGTVASSTRTVTYTLVTGP